MTDRIVAALEKGTRPWKRPWRPAEGTGTGFPVNALTGHSYRGINVLLLWLSAAEQGFGYDIWLTYRQAQQLGGHVRKGEMATNTVIFKPVKVPAKDRHGELLRDEHGEVVMTEVPMIKANPLFNIAQCDDLPAHFYEKPATTRRGDSRDNPAGHAPGAGYPECQRREGDQCGAEPGVLQSVTGPDCDAAVVTV